VIPGHATPEGTERYRRRFSQLAAEGHFRLHDGLWLSSIGLGTYLGEADGATDNAYEEAALVALASGCNVFDTAINYRHQRSERALGRALERAVSEGLAARDEIFVATKGGFLPFDGSVPADPSRFLRVTFVDSGLLDESELVAGCHGLAATFLASQLRGSLANLGLETLDLYYLHNPETQLQAVSPQTVASRLRAAFAELEARAEEGRIMGYGVATWSALRVLPRTRDYLSLEQLASLAREASGSGPCRLRAAQLPLNLAMPEALIQPTQEIADVAVPALVSARKLGLAAFASASILQGRLAGGLPPEIVQAFPGLESDAQRALQFTRSAPGVTVALVGMSRSEHVRENLALARTEPAPHEAFRKLFGHGHD
jgi:aryl-alcohol dehydrogenase-like predicted oxidoreductase